MSELFVRAAQAIVRPHRAFQQIQLHERLSYRAILPSLLIGGFLFIFFHSRFVVGLWVWELYYEPAVVLSYMFSSVGGWLLCTHGLYVLARWLGKPVALERLDIASFYLWFVWVIMPVFDVPHLFGIKTVFVVSRWELLNTFNGHFSWLIAFPILCIQLNFLVRDLIGLRHPRWASWVIAPMIFASARFVIEPMSSLLEWLLHAIGYEQNFWVGQYYLVGVACIVMVFWRLRLLGRSRRLTIAGCAFTVTCFLTGSVWALQQPMMQNLNGPPPAPRTLVPIIVRPLISQSPVRVSPQAVFGPFLDGIDHAGSILVILDDASVHDDGEPPVSCTVTLTAANGVLHDGLPQAQCNLGVYDGDRFHLLREGPAWRELHGPMTSTATWDHVGPPATGLAGGVDGHPAAVQVVVRVHGGGDYTKEDVLQVTDITIAFEDSSRMSW